MTDQRVPRVGETVLFTPNPDDNVSKSNHNDAPIPAIITRVWGPNCVNLKIFPDCGPVQDRTSVVHSSQNPAGYHFEFIENDPRHVHIDDLSDDDMISMTVLSYESDLVAFGNFLLTKHGTRDATGEPARVHGADLANWREEIKVNR